MFTTETYATHAGRALELDLFIPAVEGGEAGRPCIICVHGGGWSGGVRKQFHPHCEDLAARGHVAVSISYRLSTEATWPAQLLDCQAAVRWVRSNAGRLGVDRTRVGAVGSSAGGHLVACLGTREDAEAAARGEPSSRVNCVVDIHGVHDFAAWEGRDVLERLCGGKLSEHREVWLDASPARFVDAQTPPTLIMHAPDDPTVPYDQSVRMAAALATAARPFEFLPTPGSGHGFVYKLQTNPHAQRYWPAALMWLERWLG